MDDFIRRDIGYAILGALASNVLVAFAAVAGWGEDLGAALLFAAGVAGLVVFVALWDLGWKLAFPPKPGAARTPAWQWIALLVAPLVALAVLGALVVAFD